MWVSSTYYVNRRRRRTWLVPPKHDVCLVIVDRSAKYLSRGFVKKEGWACSTEVFFGSGVLLVCISSLFVVLCSFHSFSFPAGYG